MRNAPSVSSVVSRALVVSVAIGVLLVSLLLHAAPQDLRLVEAAKRNEPKAAAGRLKPGGPSINGNTAQPDGATARFNDGVLEIVIPAPGASRAKGQQIPIQ